MCLSHRLAGLLYQLARIHLRATARECSSSSSSGSGSSSSSRAQGGYPLPFWASSLLPAVARERELEAALVLLRHFLRLQQQQQRLLLAAHGNQQQQQQQQYTEAPCLHLPSASRETQDVVSSSRSDQVHLPAKFQTSREACLCRKKTGISSLVEMMQHDFRNSG